MPNIIICPHCNKELELTDALKHQIEEEVKSVIEGKHLEEIEAVKLRVQEAASKKAREEYNLLITTLKEENQEQKEKNSKQQEELSDLLKEMRKVRQEAEEEKLKAQKTIAEEEERIKLETRRKLEEEHSLVDAAKDKKLQDAIRANEELRHKLEQGSQQTQGEVLELELEEILAKEFPRDEIRPVAKGVRGADVLQIVMDKTGRECGGILWESKNAKWSDTWIPKLKDDKRAIGAKFAVLVSVNLPSDITNFGLRGDVWVTNRKSLVGLGHALRINVGQVFFAALASEGKDEKKENLYQYFSGIEFKNRVEAIVESFTTLQIEIEREKRWYASKWARQEKEIRRVIDQTHRMYGELQGIIGQEMPELKGLDSLELASGE